ncbi:tubulointerstitial nephritis antigen-like isoform X1 [Natator depressus]|uniref:tubulointerstitial nephritis antigen-like isoform X1 n=1 Tax=Natator depressus TaxID=27790 RepID=UPI003EB7370C
MRLLWTLLTLWLLAVEDLSAHRARTRRELAPGLHEQGIRDASGSYCERNNACCVGRDDACTVPYLDTICYCDLFCNRTISDCCPDFWEYCLGIPPPLAVHKGCDRGEHKYPTGATYMENCNLCTCSGNGKWDCEQHPCLIDGEMIDAINRGNYGWRAANYSHFWGMTLDEGVRHRLGTIKPPPTVMNMNELQMSMDTNEWLPSHFNAADKWPGLILEPLDQGNCAGSWAFSTAAVASDRISIHSMGHMTPALSPQNLISCDTRNQQGCSGGRIDRAWWYLRRRGVVTDSCYPFTSWEKDSAHTGRPCMMQSRSTGRGKRQATQQCPNPQAHSNEIYQSTPAYRLSSSEKEIMKELMENGPVQAIMEVHEDFFVYKSGVYRHTPVMAGKPERHRRHGTHSVKITGRRSEPRCARCSRSRSWFKQTKEGLFPHFTGGEKRGRPRGRRRSTGWLRTPGASTGVRTATSASPGVPTSARSRPSWWASGAASAWRTCGAGSEPAGWPRVARGGLSSHSPDVLHEAQV